MADTADFSTKIDREITSAIALSGQPGGAMLLAPKSLQELMEFAKLMAVSGAAIRPQFRGNPGTCLAILMQALKWNADPWAVANKAYVVRNKSGEETISYEAQLIHAIVNTRAPLASKLTAIFTGAGETRACLVSGLLRGETKPSPYQSPMVKQIGVKNSPLWVTDPDQQLWYFSTRSWARRYVPEILLGIYTPEEMRGEIIDIQAQEIAAARDVEAELDAFGLPPLPETSAEPENGTPASTPPMDAEPGDAPPTGSAEAQAQLFADNLVAKVQRKGRGWDWPAYAEELLTIARTLPREQFGEFRRANASMINSLRMSDKEQWARVQQTLADYERGDNL